MTKRYILMKDNVHVDTRSLKHVRMYRDDGFELIGYLNKGWLRWIK